MVGQLELDMTHISQNLSKELVIVNPDLQVS